MMVDDGSNIDVNEDNNDTMSPPEIGMVEPSVLSSSSSTTTITTSTTVTTIPHLCSNLSQNQPPLPSSPPPPPQQLLVIATRIHLGESSSSQINTVVIQQQMEQFYHFCHECHRDFHHPHDNNSNNQNIDTIVRGVIAVDVTPNEDLIRIVRAALHNHDTDRSTTTMMNDIDIVPVQPWGKFTPALNALLTYAANALRTLVVTSTNGSSGAIPPRVVGGCILYCSLETTNNNGNTSSSSSSCHPIRTLFQHMDYDTTLVCGAVLPGHDYRNEQPPPAQQSSTTKTPTTTILNGRTSPWNTFALWNINKLSKIGFVSVSDGLHVDLTTTTATTKSIAGIEEVTTIALLQKLFNPHTEMMAKLISLSHPTNSDGSSNNGGAGVLWDTSSTTDVGRQQWHEYKMQSKYQRAQEQLQLLALAAPGSVHSNLDAPPPSESSIPSGIVYHY